MLLDYVGGVPVVGMVLGRYWATSDIAEDWVVEWISGQLYRTYYETETIKQFNRNWENLKKDL